jgi:hypothetical protein
MWRAYPAGIVPLRVALLLSMYSQPAESRPRMFMLRTFSSLLCMRPRHHLHFLTVAWRPAGEPGLSPRHEFHVSDVTRRLQCGGDRLGNAEHVGHHTAGEPRSEGSPPPASPALRGARLVVPQPVDGGSRPGWSEPSRPVNCWKSYSNASTLVLNYGQQHRTSIAGCRACEMKTSDAVWTEPHASTWLCARRSQASQHLEGVSFTSQTSQDVWSVAVIALEMLSTPITQQTGRIPRDHHLLPAQHFEVLAWWYHNLWMVGLDQAGVSHQDDDTCELLEIRQEGFPPCGHLRPIAQDLHCRVQSLRDEDERRRHASQVCAVAGTHLS